MAMKTNAYLAKKAAERQAMLDIGTDVGWQKALDYVCCALHDETVMKGDPWGKDRILTLIRAVKDREQHYHEAFEAKAENDVARDHLDRELKDIFGDSMEPFHVRYPYIKEANYKGKGR